jgi:oligosaccharide repeat unit polymerase
MTFPAILIVFLSLAGIGVSRLLLGAWINHLSIYCATWGVSLFAYELALVAYNPICAEAWVYIVVAWASLFLGSALVVFAAGKRNLQKPVMPEFNPNYLRIPIIIFILIGTVSLIQQMKQMQAEFGGVFSALVLNPNEIYEKRFEGELSGVPYLFFLGSPAACLAGAYTARVGKLTFTGVLPLLWAAVSGLLSMQRAGLLISAPLFLYAYLFAPKKHGFRISKRWLIITAATLVVLSGFFLLIGSHRGSYAYQTGQTQSLNNAADYVAGFPSLYLYLSITGPTFSQYLLHPELDNYSFFGSNSFAPIWRLLSKLGFLTYVPYYTPFYHMPEEGNQGTYLAYIHADFGPAGIVLVPSILGGLLTLLGLRNSRGFRMSRLMMYANLLVVVTFSFSGWYLGLTFWFVSFVACTLVGCWIDHRCELRSQRTALRAV